MAPEMFGGAVSTRSDVYALGVMTYELLVGARPFKGTMAELLDKHLHESLPREPLVQRSVDADLIEVLERATHKNALYRYKTARQFLRALQQAVPEATAPTPPGIDLASLVAHTRGKADRAEAPADADSTDSSSYFERLSTLAARKSKDKTAPDKSAVEVRAQPEHAPTAPERPTLLEVDVPCVACGYNLRTLPLSGNCPECNGTVSASLDPQRLMFADPSWLSRIASGQKLINIAIGVGISLNIAMPMIGMALLRTGALNSFDSQDQLEEFNRVSNKIAAMIFLFPFTLLAVGLFRLTVSEPSPSRSMSPGIARWIGRVSVSCLPIGMASYLLDLAPAAYRSWLPAMMGVAGVLAVLSLLSHVRMLALRVPNPTLAGRARYLTWAITVLAVLATVGFAAREETLQVPAIVGLVVAVVLSYAVLVFFRRGLKRVAAEAVRHPGQAPRRGIAESAEPGGDLTTGADIQCIQCGYPLRSLSITSNCPECGTPISTTLRDGLRFADPAWIARVTRGLNNILKGFVILLFILVPFLTLLFIPESVSSTVLAFRGVFFGILTPGFVALAAIIIAIPGVLLATSPEPGGKSRRRFIGSRRIARLAAPCLVALATLLAAMAFSNRVPALVLWTGLIPVFLITSWLITAGSLLTYLLKLTGFGVDRDGRKENAAFLVDKCGV